MSARLSSWWPIAIALFLAIGFGQTTLRASHSPTDSGLSNGTVSVLGTGEYVVSLDTAGAYPGKLNLTITVQSTDGEVVSGEWQVVVSDAGTPGTISGSLSGGSVTVNESGDLILSGVQLQVASGTESFASLTVGSGSLDADLGQVETQGTLRIDF